jgi:hypothetical protein
MFLAGDTHQRIYDSYVSLGSLGIAIRGRSSRLTLSHRSTREILTVAQALLGGESWDDLDGRIPIRTTRPPPMAAWLPDLG